MSEPLRVIIFGLSITSSWGNGHATTYRGLIQGLAALGHHVTFLERDLPWYAKNRDLPNPPYARLHLYASLAEVKRKFGDLVRSADLVIVGSYVPQGTELGDWVTRTARGVTAFYDIDTPVTLGKLARGENEYVSPRLISRYDLYLSFTGGPTLRRIERQFGAAMARPLYCSVDPLLYRPQAVQPVYQLGYMGTYSADRQSSLETFLLEPARRLPKLRMVVAGPQYPSDIVWPANVVRIVHLSPARHPAFYSKQKFTLNVTREEMRTAGYSPSVRLFEAAACGTPIISDDWPGLDEFLRPSEEILIAYSTEDVLRYVRNTDESERLAIAAKARERILSRHTAMHRAAELEEYVLALLGSQGRSSQRVVPGALGSLKTQTRTSIA
jgi:spore maturation protein CgeB